MLLSIILALKTFYIICVYIYMYIIWKLNLQVNDNWFSIEVYHHRKGANWRTKTAFFHAAILDLQHITLLMSLNRPTHLTNPKVYI